MWDEKFEQNLAVLVNICCLGRIKMLSVMFSTTISTYKI